ncbi:MAG TPA: hypothetical protein VF348_08830, partial [Usitatibacter sp.]
MTVITDKKAFEKAVPILATDAKRLPKLLDSLSPAERHWAAASGFDGAANAVAILPDAKGGIARVLAGVRAGDDPWAIAGLALKLPRGRYALGKGPVTIAPEKAAFAWDLGGYQFTRYKKAKRKPADLQLEGSSRVKEALDMAQAVRLVRDMVNTPAEDMGPEQLSDIAREQAELFGGEFDEWVGDELLAQNFPAIHAVGRAAARAPRLLEINWGNPKHPKVAIVGKGVCFDSGGLDIKTAEGMRLMKKDMGGAAHAIALSRLIMQRELPVRLHMVVPTVENAISGNAYRPGDVVRTRKGLTVEIGNTDAEGREHRAQPLRLAPDRAPRAARVVPREHVEVRPRDLLGNEVVEEERGDDGSRVAAPARVVDVGDLRVEEAPVVAPQRQAPDRIVECLGLRQQLRGELFVVREEHRQLWAQRH